MTINDKILMDEKINEGKLWVSKKVVEKVIFNTLNAESYQVNAVKITNFNDQNNLAALIKIKVSTQSNLSVEKTKIINLILKRIKHVLNLNTMALNLVFSANGTSNES